MRRCLLFLMLAGALSCSPSPTSQEYDSAKARQTLIAALEAWKKGQAAELSRRMPPIRFVDEDWASGWLLIDYQIQQPEGVMRPFQLAHVELTLRNRQGQIVKRTAGYQVALQPRLAVLRAES